MMSKTVTIDHSPERAVLYRQTHAVVALDIIRATTTAVTAVAAGRQCFPVASLQQARERAATLPDRLLVGELEGVMPAGFDLNNSPAAIAQRHDIDRPVILLSSSGTRLMCAISEAPAAYVACLRNYRAQVRHLAAQDLPVAIIGAGTRGEPREEDELCCAWIASGLLAAGYEVHDERTADIVHRWHGASLDPIAEARSARYLGDSGQTADLDFILTHIDDLTAVYYLDQSCQVRSLPADQPYPRDGR